MDMELKMNRSSGKVLGMVAAGLLVATALTTTAVVAPITPLRAETQAVYDPSRGFADLAQQVMPAVINVQVRFANVAENSDSSQLPEQFRNLPENSPFRDFFEQFQRGNPQQQPTPRRGMAQGSGFIISADGYAVTNNHVVNNAEEVTVTDKDGNEYKADVIGTDSKTDLALIKIKGDKSFAFVKFAPEKPRVGDWVMAVGNPFGLGGTVTTGIVSALGRDIGAGPYDDFMQIDASINHGNSGGPAFNMKGEVIGVNTAIFSPSGGSVGIGFAIPAAMTQEVVESLKTTGSVTRGWLGVQIQPVTEDVAESLNLAPNKGALVADVTEGSPALTAGIQTGDTILKLNGEDVSDPRDLARKVARLKLNQSYPMEIVRDGKPMTIDVKIGTMPVDQTVAAKTGNDNAPAEETKLPQLGMQLEPAEDGAGVKVVGVTPDGVAAEQGIRNGDVIIEVAGEQVNGPADVKARLAEVVAAKQKRVLVLVRSGENQRFVALSLEQQNKG
jgi:serine protease Do